MTRGFIIEAKFAKISINTLILNYSFGLSKVYTKYGLAYRPLIHPADGNFTLRTLKLRWKNAEILVVFVNHCIMDMALLP